jgi:hypothetical protein
MVGCWRGGDVPPTEPARPAEGETWTALGQCTGDTWGEVTINISLRERGQTIVATGTLDFDDRHTEAKLRGKRDAPRHLHLKGSMTEPEGLGTTWGLELDIELGYDGHRIERMIFTELTDDGERLDLCSSKRR